MPSRKPSSPVLDTGDDIDADAASPSDMLALAEQAEAEAAEAEAVAAAARARARAIRLRREAEQAAKSEPDPPSDGVETAQVADDDDAVVDEINESAAEEAPAIEHERRLRPPGSRFWKRLAVGVAVLATIALLSASGFMVVNHRQVQAEQRRAAEFAAAARQGVVTLMSLDFNHAKEDVQRIIDSSTGQFKTDFEATAEDFTKVAEQSKVVTDVTVNSTAVDSMTDDSAVVLVAATSHITNAAGAKQDPRNWRLSVSVARDGDQIKLSKVEFVP
ncbi:hypothetical protein AFM11_10430 [Mycolicibacterium wolinskyi]|uniref:Bacterial virulence protein VirB8 domain-containing protein n=1 Tax=Mycolicibacterium wolinskyi TaxID=59750 RepID=A0A132PQ01_9MYCO|nr:hypothetical protein [Mycolicibacterium wolinskyi]KWX24375.1 hypothetical protein AFM11_10430 [Mycolicibacterium wolinskyi]